MLFMAEHPRNQADNGQRLLGILRSFLIRRADTCPASAFLRSNNVLGEEGARIRALLVCRVVLV